VNCTMCGAPEFDCFCFEPVQPEPTYEEYCAAQSHAYYADEYDWTEAPEAERDRAKAEAGRCYCGARRYPAGGPDTHDDEEVIETDRNRPRAAEGSQPIGGAK
jgi:hypothetical protein